MKFLNSGNVVRLSLDQIEIGERLRKVREAQIANLIAMAEDTGITTPIHVRKTRDGYVLIDGAHRLEAARRLGLAEITAIAVECSADEASAMEGSNNLGAARMTPLQTAVFAASWRRAYYKMHPERSQGVFKGNQHTGKKSNKNNENLVSPENGLTTAIADAFGKKKAQIYKIMSVAERLTAVEIAALDAMEAPLSLEDLGAIGKLTNPEEREAVVRKLSLGAAKSVSQARRAWSAEAGAAAQVPEVNPTDKAFNDLLKAWKRAPMTAKKRFLFEHSKEIWTCQNAGAALKDWADAKEIDPKHWEGDK